MGISFKVIFPSFTSIFRPCKEAHQTYPKMGHKVRQSGNIWGRKREIERRNNSVKKVRRRMIPFKKMF